MKHSLFERFVAMVLAFTLIMSTGVLDSAGWLIARAVAQEETITETTKEGSKVVSDTDGVVVTLEEKKTQEEPAVPAEPAASGSTTKPVVPAEPAAPAESGTSAKPAAPAGSGTSAEPAAPAGSGTSAESAVPAESGTPAAPAASGTPTETPQYSDLKVVMKYYYQDGKTTEEDDEFTVAYNAERQGYYLEMDVPTREGYTTSIPEITINEEENKIQHLFPRLGDGVTETIMVTFTPVAAADQAEDKLTVNVEVIYEDGSQEPSKSSSQVSFDADMECYPFEMTVAAKEGYSIKSTDPAAPFMNVDGSTVRGAFLREEGKTSADVKIVLAKNSAADTLDHPAEPGTGDEYIGEVEKPVAPVGDQLGVTVKYIYENGVMAAADASLTVEYDEAKAGYPVSLSIPAEEGFTAHIDNVPVTGTYNKLVAKHEGKNEITITVTYVANDVTYVAVSKLQKPDGSYQEERTELTGKVGMLTNAFAEKEGYVLADAQQSAIAADGSTVVTATYDRRLITLLMTLRAAPISDLRTACSKVNRLCLRVKRADLKCPQKKS